MKTEIKLLEEYVKVITLGKTAFDGYCKISGLKGLSFGHNIVYPLEDHKQLISSYHPSKRNTNTETLTWDMWIDVFRSAHCLLKLQNRACSQIIFHSTKCTIKTNKNFSFSAKMKISNSNDSFPIRI